MMKRIIPAMLVAVGLLALSTTTFARVVTASGPCDNGGQWIIVTTLDSQGRVTSIRGTDCSGRNWTGHCTILELPADPQQPGDVYHEGTAGDWVRYNVNGDGIMTEMWGRDTEGHYWATSIEGVQLT